MNEHPDPQADTTAAAERELSRLNAQVAAMRTVLVGLLQDVVRAEKQLDDSQAHRLVEANERLVITALGAQNEADTAHDALDEVSRAAGLDPLTGLANRALLLDRLAQALSNARRHDTRVALLFLDLDNFKQINDSFGHATGDRALQLVADGLRSLVRETDTVSRHGGDEFLILLSEISQATDAALIAEKVNAALAYYSSIDDHAVRLTASIGISVYPEDGADAHTLIDHADAAMYRAKKQPLGGFAFHLNQPVADTALPRSDRRRPTHRELTLAEHAALNAQLCEANEQLVLAALDARHHVLAGQVRRG